MFRRRSTDAPEAPDLADTGADDSGLPPRPGLTPKKGAPTPKRSAAEANRRQAPYQAPPDRKTAAKLARQRDAGERQRRAEAMRRGDDSALPAKDQGPVKALARNVVDARRSIGEYYMLIVLLLIVLLFLHGQTVKFLAEGAVLVILAVLAFEGWYVSRRVKRLAAERYPGQSTRGVTAYTVMRNISYRKLRMPKPKVKPGDQI